MPPEPTDAPSASPRWTGLILPVTIVGAVLVFLVPLPAGVLDLLLSGNVTLAVLVLLTVLSIRTPQEFAAFPTILVTTTLTRLVLNVAVTRRILTHGGEQGLDAAGRVIRAFGEFVAGDQVVVGAILFAILVIIQFVVITKGATRISEVAARFMLDGLPGRQMAIDADLHAGLIDQHEAARRRDSLYRQADFFGAMDGAGKFVRGDAVAGVLITFVNIVAGLYLGMFEHGMSLGEAVEVFTMLTIGDGLVSQVPAFLISLASGLIVTRSSSDSDLGRDVTTQLFGRPDVLAVAAGFLALLAFCGLPRLPMLTLAAALGAGAYVLRTARSDRASAEEPAAEEPGPARPEPPPSERIDDLLQADPLELEVGYRLIALSDPARGDLLGRIRAVRQKVARELGLVLPQVRIRDELGLGANDYRFKVRGVAIARGTAYAGRLLAIPPAGLVARPDGRDGVDPVTGQPAVWIHADGREVAELAGCRVVEAAAVVAGHFGEAVLDHADELMTHDQVRHLLDRTRKAAPALVEELVPALLRPSEVRRVLQNLLRERVSIRDAEVILEALAEEAPRTRDTAELTEAVRRALGRRLVQPHLNPAGRLRHAALAPTLDDRIADPDDPPTGEEARAIVRAIAEAVAPLIESGAPALVVTSPDARPILKDLTRTDLPRLVVLSRREIPRDTPTELIATADLPDASTPPRPRSRRDTLTTPRASNR